MENSAQVARLLLQIKAIKLNAKNPFTWASGLKSPIYCDNRITLSHTWVRNEIKQAFVKAADHFDTFDVIAGVATAGIPHGALLADALGLPFVYVRSKTKKHGRQNKIEGALLPEHRVLVVEDLISTGGSSMEAIDALQSEVAEVVGLLAIFTYELEHAQKRFADAQIKVQTLTTYSDLLAIAMEMGYIDQNDHSLLKAWKKSPSTWNPT
ncbi:MAG: orotate phosphoribosyltransferase [Saprospiraceae bacterium]|nr:orotate phosphoribosyltransferase [Saprospiraceae bacterium]